jgi:hypothetical protein
MGVLLAAIFLAIVAAVVYVQRRPLAHVQAMVLGGSIAPGCVIGEAIVLLVLALIFAAAHFMGLVTY